MYLPENGTPLVPIGLHDAEEIRRAVATLWRLSRSAAYQRAVDEEAPPVARHRPHNASVFMSYDFHLTPAGPRLIEINTNAGGALLTAASSWRLFGSSTPPCSGVPSPAAFERAVVDMFRGEHAAVFGSGRPLRTVAIVDEQPARQPLAAEFEMLRAMLGGAGVLAVVREPRDLRPDPRGRLMVGGLPIDLVYLRLCDFYLRRPESAAIREAYLAEKVCLTPNPREHHLLADKRNLVRLSDRRFLRSLGLGEEEVERLAALVPETFEVTRLDMSAAYRRRRHYYFKPAAGYGGRGVYDGRGLSLRKLAEVYHEDTLMQRRVDPPRMPPGPAGDSGMRYDVRAYAYRDYIFAVGARAWRGQTATTRPGAGTFAAVCIAAGAEASLEARGASLSRPGVHSPAAQSRLPG